MNSQNFAHLESIYRNYDIRGRYPDEITAQEVEKIGQAIVRKYNLKKVAVGRDIRPSADVLFSALTRGITSQGCAVVDLGQVTTPMTYFVCGQPEIDASVMITASHMPAEYNGLKISIEDAKPVGQAELQEIKTLVETTDFEPVNQPGEIVTNYPLVAWQHFFRERFDFKAKPFKIVVDPANMIGLMEIDTFKNFGNEIIVSAINDSPDPTCPSHEANPIKLETLAELSQTVIKQGADFGIAFDGDADRVGFVDERGQPVTSDLIGALLARRLLQDTPGAHIIVDPRSTKAIEKVVAQAGGSIERYMVGHTNIRTKMRQSGAVLGIELAGHFFFKDTNYSEGGPLPAFLIMDLMMREQKTLSALVAEVREFHHSGEINSEITRSSTDIYQSLREAFPDAVVTTLDGLTLTQADWWCNVRPSANDPVMRLNLEANSADIMEKQRDAVLKIIRS
jgi:phosphomannomutase